MISFLITAWKEEKTIGKCINCIINSNYSGLEDDFEILLGCPDKETYLAALNEVKLFGFEDKLIWIEDRGKGKPLALNMMLDRSKGRILIFTDGDVYFGKNAIKELISHFKSLDKQVKKQFILTGRPISIDSENTMMGYFGHLLSDAAHHKRTVDLTDNPVGNSLNFVKKRKFFPASGYIYAMFKTSIRFPSDCLADDGYISYLVYNQGGKIEYEPKALAYVKYPTNLSDYFKQKKRSTGGYMQLWEYGVVKQETKSRSFWRELEYFWFPIKYAQGIKQFFWSLLLYPIRLWLWLQIYWERKIIKKDFIRTWVRVESTK